MYYKIVIVIEWIDECRRSVFFLVVVKRERAKLLEKYHSVVSWKQHTHTHTLTRSTWLTCVWSVRKFRWNSPPNNIAIKLYAQISLRSITITMTIGLSVRPFELCDAFTVNHVTYEQSQQQQQQLLKPCTYNYSVAQMDRTWHTFDTCHCALKTITAETLAFHLTYPRLKFHWMRFAFDWLQTQIFNLSLCHTSANHEIRAICGCVCASSTLLAFSSLIIIQLLLVSV